MLIERIVTGVLAVLLIKPVLYDFPMYMAPTSFRKYLKYVLGSIYVFSFLFCLRWYLVVFVAVIIPGLIFYLR